ncbi:MAG: polysaccharide deacetylase family protein [Clostridia bacterium]|nr:polysaccharide deacetylase family protein [Clostridia bacterium]
MKKTVVLLICVAMFVSVVGCSKTQDNDNTEMSQSELTVPPTQSYTQLETIPVPPSTETTAPQTTQPVTEVQTEAATKESVTQPPSPSPVKTIDKNYNSVYGERTNTKKTYTGLEPLEKITLPVVDPDNLKGLSEKRVGHSYGVSENGVPHSISVNNQKIYKKYNGICLDTSGEKVIYLTFDCGYENGYTSKILDVLKAKGVPAAFFVTLPYLESAPEVAARMINEGHVVGNHSDTHPDFSTISRTKMAKEIENVENYLRVHFGYASPYFRFPQGAYSESALDLVDSIGYKAVFWSSAYADWDTDNQKGKDYAYKTVTSRLHPGCVLLLHAVSKDNANALGDIIDYAREQGYVFKPLP